MSDRRVYIGTLDDKIKGRWPTGQRRVLKSVKRWEDFCLPAYSTVQVLVPTSLQASIRN